MTATDLSRTAEGPQEMGPRKGATADELLRELGSVLRLSEADAARLADLPPAEDEQTMILNMGPQHPSTHGVLRLMLELEGETVLRTKPIIGYLHTGMEKTGETLTYVQGATNTTRMDYAAPLFNELVFSLATEKLLGIENEIPERAQWIRMLLCELNRMSSHLLFLATNGMDLGAVSMMIYGWREREETLRLLEMITGLRMNHNFIRPGGVAADLPDGWREELLALLDQVEPHLDDLDSLLTGQPIWRERLQGVGVISTEELLGIEVPERATWVRMLLCEVNRMASHLLFQATNGMDIGAVGIMIYGWRDREDVLRYMERVTGLRMNHNFIRPGGVAADLPDGWRDAVLRVLDLVEPRLDEYEVLMNGQPIWRERLQGVGVITAEEAIALGATGPILRSTGVPWDLRKDEPYLRYDQVEFGVVVGSYGDCFDRYSIRLNEVRESMAIVRQILDKLPGGDYRIQDRKVTPPPRGRIDESMEALIHHFKIFTEGFKVPEGEVYVSIESPRGELGCYMVSDGSAKPYRMHIRGPSFVNLQSMPHMLRGGLIADAVAVISSVDPIMGEVDR